MRIPAGILLLLVWSAAAAASTAAELVDADGRRLVFDQPYNRIISLYPAHTENLLALGLDRELIGISTSDDEQAAGMQGRQRYSYREDAEKFIAARPDLILVRPMISRGYPGLIAKLRGVGITVVSLQPLHVEEMFDYWLALGRLSGREAQARTMVADFSGQLTAIRAKLAEIPPEKRQKVYFEAIHSKMKTFAPTSMAIFVLEAAGGINVAIDADQVRSTNIAEYGKEKILSHADEIEVFIAQQGRMNRVTRDDIVSEPGFSVIRAIRDNRILLVDEANISRPTAGLLTGIRTIAGYLYPDAGLPVSGSGRRK